MKSIHNEEFAIVSVIVPVYNCERYLERCIKSLINQSYNNLQIVLIDDGSTDHSGEICDNYAAMDHRIHVIHQNNSGVSKARNVGLDMASGEFIAFIDSDDWVHNKYFEIMMECQRKSNADVVICRSITTGEFVEDKTMDNIDIEYYPLNVQAVLQDGVIKTRVWARCYRALLLDGVRFPEGINLGEDTCFNLKVLISSDECSCVIVDQSMYYYFVARPDSLVHTANYKQLFVVAQWYITQMQTADANKDKKQIWCHEACKVLLACRYLNMFDSDKKVCMECNKSLRECVAMMKKYKSNRWFYYVILYKLPLLYRLYRIYTDKTMLVWEKEQKKRHN